MSNSNAVLAQNATQLAISTPSEINIGGIVTMLFLRKQDEHGRATFGTNRGKQNLFASTCAWVKSLRGINAKEHLPEEIELQIRVACDKAVSDAFTNVLQSYDRFTIKTGGLRTLIAKDGSIKNREAFAGIHAARDACANEHRLCDMLTLRQKQEQINRLLDKPALEDDQRAMLSRLQKQVDILSAEIAKP